MPRLWLYLMTIVFLVGCYRSTGVPNNPSEVFQVSDQLIEDLSGGLDSSARVGDFVVQSRNIYLAINGSFGSQHRDYYGVPAAGALLDANTRSVNAFQVIQTSLDDSLIQMTASVNLNPGSPVVYESGHVESPSDEHVVLVLQGRVWDKDESLRQNGAQVDSDGFVIDVLVETRMDLLNTQQTDINDNEPVRFVSITTVIENQSEAAAPIFTVNDLAVINPNATTPFVAYPGWGLKRGQGIAYPNYVAMLTRQASGAQYGFTSPMDSVFSTAVHDYGDYQYLAVGKSGHPQQNLEPGSALTYMRDFFVLPIGTSGEAVYGQLINQTKKNTQPNNPYFQTGALFTRFSFQNTPGGTTEVHAINHDFQVFNGLQYEPLGDRTYPLYGDLTLESGFRLDFPKDSQLGIYFEPVNSEPEWVDKRINEDTDDEGNTVITEDPIVMVQDEAFDLGNVTVGKRHYEQRLLVSSKSQRRLMSRVNVFSEDPDQSVIQGLLPRSFQGNTSYVISTTDSSLNLPLGSYKAVMGRGPLYNLNIQPVSIAEQTDDEGNTTVSVDPSRFDAEMEPAIQFPGFLSADFGIRSANDPNGTLDKSQMVLMAYAEDLDVVFFADRYNDPQISQRFDAIANAQGGFDTSDVDNEIDSFYDELAVSRSVSVPSAPATSYPYGRGTYTVLNLPDEVDQEELKIPLINQSPGHFVEQIHENFKGSLVQLERPRAPKIGLFQAISQMLGDGNQTLDAQSLLVQDNVNMDFIQLLAGNRYDEYLQTRADWFALLNAGIFIPATGGSDGADTASIAIGAVRTWIATNNTTLRENDLQDFWAQAASGNMFVSNGPLLDVDLNGVNESQKAEPGETVTTGKTVEFNIDLKAGYWIPIKEVRIIVDGEINRTYNITNMAELDRWQATTVIEFDEPGQHWVVVEVGATLDELVHPELAEMPGNFGRYKPGHLPLAFTNPIFVQSSF